MQAREFENIDIHPTKTCFDDCAAFINRAAMKGDGNLLRKLKLCHGIATFKDGKEYSHSWLELPSLGEVIDFGLIEGSFCEYRVNTKEYYAERGIKERTIYSMEQVAVAGRITGHCGPWVKRYQVLCNDPEYRTDLPEILETLGARQVFSDT